MITVIIPVLNEEETIAEVVKFAIGSENVSEVLVVDDKSLDNTITAAKESGANVITSTKLGKGASMKDGLFCAKNEIIVFLDGDIHPYPPFTIKKLTDPIINDTSDFVKAAFGRNAGRVTELVAKPLLNIFFPDICHFDQPLSGMISGKKSFFEKIDFYDGYGVDIGILLDMHLLNARIAEVNIGYLANKSKPWQALGKMSREVAGAIIAKAAQRNKSLVTLEELQSFSEIRGQMDFAIKQGVKGLQKMAIFDMDNTLLVGRFIDTCARIHGFERELLELRNTEKDAVILTKSIAMLIKGLKISEILTITDFIPLVKDASNVIQQLKSKGYVVGIISDSYDVVVNHVKNKVGADFSFGNELEFSKSIATGEVKIPSSFFNNQQSICNHSYCKTNTLQYIVKQYGIQINNTIAVGDNESDLCMVKNAGIGVAFCSNNQMLNFVADKKIEIRALNEILDFA